MTLAPPAPAAPQAPATGLEPLLLPPGLKLSPEQFALVCEANPEAVLELTAAGQVIAMTPTGGETGSRNTRLLFRLQAWAERRGGWVVFDSSGGFRLPDGSVHSPDAAVVRLERWQALTPEQRRGFPPLCPDLVVELVSPPCDEGLRGSEALRRKMAAYLANGARLGWLLFPGQQAVEIWQPGADPAAPVAMQRIEAAEALEGANSCRGCGWSWRRSGRARTSVPTCLELGPGFAVVVASDKLFYWLFQHQPDRILPLLPDLPPDASGYTFSAPVLKLGAGAQRARISPRWAVSAAARAA